MNFLTRLQALDRVLSEPATPPVIAPIETRPPTSEEAARVALRTSLQGHAGRVGQSVGIYGC